MKLTPPTAQDIERAKIYELGVKNGRAQIIGELLFALGIEELIAKAVERHVEQYHDTSD